MTTPHGERCRTCRFWKLDLRPHETDPGECIDAGFGWCRRRPPQIIDHVARMCIAQPGFHQPVDRGDIACAMQVDDCTLYPATFGTNWCGEFAASQTVAGA